MDSKLHLDSTMSDFYKMNNRGIVLILTQSSVEKINSEINVTFDVLCTKKVFNDLGFEVREFLNLNKAQTHMILSLVSKEDHTNRDCLVVIVVTTGADNALCAQDGTFTVPELCHPFNDNNCPSLTSKPKLFLIQTYISNEVTAESDRNSILPTHYSIPVMTDFLVMYLVENVHSNANGAETDTQLKFIQTFCDEFEKSSQNNDLFKLLTRVQRRILLHQKDTLQMKKNWRVPTVVSMLTKNVLFSDNKN